MHPSPSRAPRGYTRAPTHANLRRRLRTRLSETRLGSRPERPRTHPAPRTLPRHVSRRGRGFHVDMDDKEGARRDAAPLLGWTSSSSPSCSSCSSSPSTSKRAPARVAERYRAACTSRDFTLVSRSTVASSARAVVLEGGAVVAAAAAAPCEQRRAHCPLIPAGAHGTRRRLHLHTLPLNRTCFVCDTRIVSFLFVLLFAMCTKWTFSDPYFLLLFLLFFFSVVFAATFGGATLASSVPTVFSSTVPIARNVSPCFSHEMDSSIAKSSSSSPPSTMPASMIAAVHDSPNFGRRNFCHCFI